MFGIGHKQDIHPARLADVNGADLDKARHDARLNMLREMEQSGQIHVTTDEARSLGSAAAQEAVQGPVAQAVEEQATTESDKTEVNAL